MAMNYVIRLFLFFVWFLLVFVKHYSCNAQSAEIPYFNFTTLEGLPSNLVYGSLTDRDSLLWMCTDAGVIQFDGSASRIYTIEVPIKVSYRRAA